VENVALRKFVERLTKTVDEQDNERLTEWCEATGCARLDAVPLRTPVRLAGEVRSVRIVPRAGAPALEANVQDGRGVVTAVFLGRRKVLGVSPGRRLVLEGVVTTDRDHKVMYNPVYELK
jgi:hypothetical protein